MIWLARGKHDSCNCCNSLNWPRCGNFNICSIKCACLIIEWGTYVDRNQIIWMFFFASVRGQLIMINICCMILSEHQTVRLQAYENLLLPSTRLSDSWHAWLDLRHTGNSYPTLTCAQCLFSDVACVVPLTCTLFLCCVSSFHLQSDKMLWLRPASPRFIFLIFAFPTLPDFTYQTVFTLSASLHTLVDSLLWVVHDGMNFIFARITY